MDLTNWRRSWRSGREDRKIGGTPKWSRDNFSKGGNSGENNDAEGVDTDDTDEIGDGIGVGEMKCRFESRLQAPE